MSSIRFSVVAQSVKNLPALQETWVRSLGWEDPPGEGNGNPLQYSCLENTMDRGAWWAAAHGVTRVRHDLATKSSQQLDLYTNPIMRVPPSWPNYFPKALPLITITLNVRLSTDEFWDIKKFSPYYPSFGASLVAQRIKRLPAMQETQAWSLGWEDPLEKETATHSSILAWRIPWTEEPGGLQSTGSQRVGHDWMPSLHSSFFFIAYLYGVMLPAFAVFHPSFIKENHYPKFR